MKERVQEKPHLSYSQINCYMTYPLKYRFHYMDQIEPPFVSSALTFGSCIHEAVGAFYQSCQKPEQQEEWLREKVNQDVQVIIGNPVLVQTGLDLLNFPTIILYQTGYSIFTLRQASLRSWRIGQDRPVRIHYLHYRGSMQERALELVGKKLSASLAIEGKLTADGLASMSAGEDMTLMLARALIEGARIDGAESVGRSMNEKRCDQPSSQRQVEMVVPVRHGSTSVEILEERSWEDFSLVA